MGIFHIQEQFLFISMVLGLIQIASDEFMPLMAIDGPGTEVENTQK